MKPCDHVLLDSDTTVKVTHSRSAPEPGLGQPLYAQDLVINGVIRVVPHPVGLGSLEEKEVRTQTHTEERPCEDTG